jgi:ketosteroid isomerase-like protein
MTATHPNAQLVSRFYTAFVNGDLDTMIGCYADDIWFSDPVFPNLRGKDVGAMWRMLGTGKTTKRIDLTFSDVDGDDRGGRAHWEAIYDFIETGRRVHNKIDATFEIRDGKIVRHQDRFDLWKWSGMALGPTGKLLGWLPPVQNAIRGKAAKGLAAFLAQR